MPTENKIRDLRDKIDSLDDKIVELLEKRSLISKNIGEIKRSTGKVVLDSQREKEIIDLLALKTKILNKVSLHLIFKNIFKISNINKRKK